MESLTSGVVDLVFPPRCPACVDAGRTEVGPLCRACGDALDDGRAAPACPRCAGTLARYDVADGSCWSCRRYGVRVVGTVRVGAYGDPLGGLVRDFKYRGRVGHGYALGRWLGASVSAAAWCDEIDVVTSVPTHWRHRLRRPLHAADVLGAQVARLAGLPYVALLRRVRAGPHQVGLSHAERIANVRGAFAMRADVSLRSARVLLVDDVKTTGATINECARVLYAGGAAAVYAAVVLTAGWTPGGGTGVLAAM
ncbi:MAG: ComF family protein [Phycisphaerae bacterium]